MKVMHLLPALESGGVETVVCTLSRALVAAGHESVVVSRGGRLAATIALDGGRHLSLDLKSKNPLTYFFRAWRLRGLLREERPDVVCVHSRVPAWLFVWANRPLGLRWITYAHGANSVSRYSEVMTKGDLTVVPSSFLADYLKRNYRFDYSKLRVIGNSVDERRFDPARVDQRNVRALRERWGLAADDFVVMAVGRISPVKGLDRLIESLPGDMKLVIVGDAEPKHWAYAERLREVAGDNVVFAGGGCDVPECLSVASVVVSANTVKPETFGLSMAEALMMNRPVVAKAFGGVLDVIRDGVDGVLVRDDDFGAALRRVRDMTFGDLRQAALARFSTKVQLERTLAALTAYRA